MRASLTLSLCAVVAAAAAAPQLKISLGVGNVIQAYGAIFYNSSSQLLLDEQLAAGDPAAGTGGAVKNAWQTSWDAEYNDGPQVHTFAIIDLNATYKLTSAWLYRSWGKFNVTLVAGADAFSGTTWTFGVGSSINPGEGWVAYNVSASAPSARYITVYVTGAPGSSMIELVFYGTMMAGVQPSLRAPAASVGAAPRPPLRMLLGGNGFVWTDMSNLTAIGPMRECGCVAPRVAPFSMMHDARHLCSAAARPAPG